MIWRIEFDVCRHFLHYFYLRKVKLIEVRNDGRVDLLKKKDFVFFALIVN